ncbi:hypothetical protein OEZ86_014066 [Tetradesmus obliquus]|nr:hypothetical protein OEZ86_014066 [Tetradesmus obliquus]
MHSFANPIPTSRRLGLSSSSEHCKLLGLNNSFPCRRSRTPSAAETLGPSVDNLHNVQRLSLTQSLELDALNRLAKLARGMPWEARREVLAESSFVKLLEKLQGQVDAGRLNAFQLSTSLYSCAALQVPLVALSSNSSSSSSGISRLLPALESAMQARLADFNDRDVSSALYAYAQLKVRRPSSLAVAEQLCKQAQSLTDRQQMGGQSLSMCLWAVATLHTAQQQQRGGSSSSSKAELTAFRAAAASLVASAVRQLRDAAFDFDVLGSQGVANSIWAAAKLELHDTALLKKGCEWVAANAGRCKVQEVMNVLWAAGVGRYRPAVLQKLTKHIASQAQALKPADVASLFHVLGLFGFDLAGQLQQQQQAALLARAQQLLPQMKPSEAASLYWGMGMARFVHCELFVELTETLGKLAQQQLAAQAALEQQGVDWQQQQQQQRQRPGQQQQQQGDGQVAEWKACPKAARLRLFAEVLRRAGVNPQERLVAAAEKAWQAGRMDKGSGRGGSRGAVQQQGGDGLGMVGASGIRASEADLLMQDRGGAVGGWASGGRGTRSRARSSGGSSRRR